MDINVKQAVKLFFANPSLEMVFFEAIANAIDADATDIKIQINLDEFNKPDTLTIKIIDNGVGLTDERFGKFSELLKVDEDTHKGVGRLVFLSYFKRSIAHLLFPTILMVNQMLLILIQTNMVQH